MEQTKRETFIQRIFAVPSVLGEGWDLGSPILSYKPHSHDEVQGFPSSSVVGLVLKYWSYKCADAPKKKDAE